MGLGYNIGERVKHDMHLMIEAYGARGLAYYKHSEGKFILKSGSGFAKEIAGCMHTEQYKKYLNRYRQLISSGAIKGHALQSDLIFDSLEDLVTQLCLFPAYHQAIKLFGENNRTLKEVLSKPDLYNKYIAHCEYYDSNWSVIHSETDTSSPIEQENTNLNTENEDELKIEEVETFLGGIKGLENYMGGMELNSFSTIEIINELLARLSKIGGEA